MTVLPMTVLPMAVRARINAIRARRESGFTYSGFSGDGTMSLRHRV
jgi:hypothetical protein